MSTDSRSSRSTGIEKLEQKTHWVALHKRDRHESPNAKKVVLVDLIIDFIQY